MKNFIKLVDKNSKWILETPDCKYELSDLSFVSKGYTSVMAKNWTGHIKWDLIPLQTGFGVALRLTPIDNIGPITFYLKKSLGEFLASGKVEISENPCVVE